MRRSFFGLYFRIGCPVPVNINKVNQFRNTGDAPGKGIQKVQRLDRVEVCKNCNQKTEPLRNSYESDLLAIFFRIGLDFFSDSAIIGIQNPYMQAAAGRRGREVCEE